mmetsp:Transcript_11560/g.26347  ORF Transcript_11560/g.26347 Transcript_11560/m.26347 type:complete len:366 (-) Transcript_11560:378-1475(-)
MSAPTAHLSCPVKIVSRTWARDRHDLFDFEADSSENSADIQRQAFTISESTACVRSGANVQMLTQEKAAPGGSEFLMGFARKGSSLWIEQARDVNPCRPLIVVKDLPGGKHDLRECETIRLGCAKIRVCQIVTASSGPVKPRLRTETAGTFCRANPEPEEDLAAKCCRICMLEGPGKDDPLVAPCSCKGSVEYVHLACLREWIRVRKNMPPPGEPCQSFTYQAMACDICKSNYVPSVLFGGEVTPLIEVPDVKPPFVVLDVRTRRSGTNGRREGAKLHVLSLAEEKPLMLGRADSCSVRIDDASISRWHASIGIREGRVVLEDHGSKFGTSVEMRRPISMDTTDSISIQVGRTVFQISSEALISC